ncbi:hypothetical protein ACG33_04420 [Steroidobacter denitrificans]|uniref:Uncharacterized protein n=1 Tax=Steroidobacter denitrificans TaxID=465721 RepID=A0A127F7D1_STEDE|nr:efflux RND transporter periplasmic adaptor subunit [Steroidobacter denitrificans]AMN46362.1 hypothetical protein ACG33_04420 [Steroidobacter denitrificans]
MSKWLIGLAALALALGAIFGGKYYQNRQAAAAAARQSWPAASVATARAQQASWDTRIRAVGTLRAVNGTRVSAQLAGNVTQIAFESGARVNKGDLLVQLDDSSQRAALRSNQARLKSAVMDLERARKLIRSHAVSQEQLQAAQREHDMAAAAVASDQAVLTKLRITAPFDGMLGIREVSLGQYVAPGTGIVDLQHWNPLLLDFALPQEVLMQLESGQAVEFKTSARPDEVFTGKIAAMAAQMDPQTRNIEVQATIDNQDDKLRPGLFGHVTLSLGRAMTGIAVPQSALTYSTFGNSIFVLAGAEHGEQVVRAKVVHVLHERQGQVLLEADDLEDGAIVVTAGQNKLRDGAVVSIDNSVSP